MLGVAIIAISILKSHDKEDSTLYNLLKVYIIAVLIIKAIALGLGLGAGYSMLNNY